MRELLPLVSIIIPCWNGEQHVAQAVESALAQTYPHKEVIVIDDGSTDGTLNVLRSFGDRIRWESGQNRGACAARNRGAEIASGAFFQFLDADDVLFDNKLARMAPLAASVDATPICGWETISKSGERWTTSPGEIGADSFAYALVNSIQTASPLHAREQFWRVGGFRTELPCAQERDLHIRLAAAGVRFTAVNTPFLQARRRDGSLSSDPHRVLLQHENIFLRARDILVQQGALTDARRRRLALAFIRDARLLVRAGDFSTAARFAKHARAMHRSGGLGEFRRAGSRVLATVAGPVLTERAIQATMAAYRAAVPRAVGTQAKKAIHENAAAAVLSRAAPLAREVLSGRQFARSRYILEEQRQAAAAQRPVKEHVKAVLDWLLLAQAATPDDGLAQAYHVITRRWGSSYPETTGYVIGSLLRAREAGFDHNDRLQDAAARMGKWLLTTQLSCGAFPGGTVAIKNPKPAMFNTGQILKGMSYLLERGMDADGWIATSARKGAAYMINTLDDDGCWRSGVSVLTNAPVHAHNVRAAWGLARYGRVVGDETAIDAARANANWISRQQKADAWFDHMSFNAGEAPLTHTIAYTIQGLMEIGAMVGDDAMIDRSRRAAEAVFARQDADTGSIPGQFAEGWQPVGDFTSMTGNAQMAIIGHRLASLTGDSNWRKRALRATAVCKRFQEIDHANPNRRGAVRGAYPSNGGYGSFWYMNWTQKFFLDALLCELDVDVT